VQVQLGTSATRNRLSTAGLHQMISRLVAVVDGVYVMLAPLSKGQHTIHFHGEAPLSPTATFILDVTYQLRVT
jgi:hypothetical protein